MRARDPVWAVLAILGIAILPGLVRAITPIGTRFLITSNGNFSDVAVDAGGNFVVVWQGYDVGGVWVQRFGRNAEARGDPIRLAAAGQASVASDADGNFIVVWTAFDSISGQRFAANGTVQGEPFVAARGDANIGPVDVGADSAGNFVVAWQDYKTAVSPPCERVASFAHFDLKAQRFDRDAAPQGVPVVVSPCLGYGAGGVGVAGDAAGRFILAWDEPFSGHLARHLTGTGLGPLSEVTSSGSYGPDVASDAAGNFVVVWSGRRGAEDFVLQGRRFDPQGVPRGPEFDIAANGFDGGVGSTLAGDLLVVVWDEPPKSVAGIRLACDGDECPAPIVTTTTTTTSSTLPCTTPQCRLSSIVRRPACAGQPLPGSVQHSLDRAVGLLDRAGAASGKKVASLRRRAGQLLRRAGRLATKASRARRATLSKECAAELRAVVTQIAGELRK